MDNRSSHDDEASTPVAGVDPVASEPAVGDTPPKTGIAEVDEAIDLVTSLDPSAPTEAAATLDTVLEKLELVLADNSGNATRA